MERPYAARRALLHPLWLGSLAVLALNDHVLKGAGILPGAITGKLSDFAGLVVAPVLLAALLRLGSRRSLFLAHLATGAVFAAIKLSPAAARAFEAFTALTPFPWQITVDPTDLMALPALALAWRVLVPAMQRPLPERPLAQRTAVVFGSLACAATSEPQEPPPTCDPEFCGVTPTEAGALSLGNTTTGERLVRLRPLKDSVQVDCETLLADPESALSRELFAPAEAWLLQPGRGLPLQNNDTAGCVAYLVDADGLSPTLLAWSSSRFPTQFVSTATNADDGLMIPLSLDSNGKLSLGPHEAVFKAPALEEPPVAPGCGSPDETVGIEWSTPVPIGGPWIVETIISSPDDCHALVLQNKSTMYVCLPKAAMPFKAGDSLMIDEHDGIAGSAPETNGEPPEGKVLILHSDTHTVVATRGNVLARYGFTGTDAPLGEPTVESDLVEGCTGAHDECGSLLVPLELSLLGAHVPSISFLRAGKSIDLADGYGTLHVVRAEAMPIRDTECPPFARSSRHYESVLVIPAGP
ncbi:hypothetical protein [Polyangium jinanense]|uniref:Uncharacterized protein n=1 Tax=Polyangium jinanense TaxID=2829994 RepID=A0A9X3XDX3_9BACT|nr:hypothetical protein [Polyangium jinanense]MDC3960055.1 hypothetical protein [Polyangium jinanense]MDC3986191.1 hypothetical protein [Polyangium jinanense]